MQTINALLDTKNEKTDWCNNANHSALLTRVGQQQDKKAFICLFEHFAPRIKSYLIKGGLSPDISDDLAQETMIAIWNKAADYDPKKAAASTWIFTIARNKRIDALRKNTRQPEFQNNNLINDIATDTDDIEKNIEHSDKVALISKAIKQLPKKQAEIIHYSFFEDKAHSQIAKEINLPLGTVKSRLRLAIKKLHSILDGE